MMLFMLINAAQAADQCYGEWVYWDDFAKNHVQKDGRVIDFDASAITTSEGQSYALFFSLVSNDHERFDRILDWTRDNLARGDFQKNLPAWKWGKSKDGSWKILDPNPASDADLWIAYSVYIASEHWGEDKYLQIAKDLLKNIADREVDDLPKLGKMLLPGVIGFRLENETWRLNPSYTPIQLLRFFAKKDDTGPWAEIAANSARMIVQTSVHGVVPDWVTYKSKAGFVDDIKVGHVSSFDAIRVYLWWAMLDPQDPLFTQIRDSLRGVEQFDVNYKYLPERILERTGDEEGAAPAGYEGALAPYRFVLYGKYPVKSWPPRDFDLGYYNSVLNLFGYGWLERRFSFNLDGSLTMRSHQECSK
jgi:endoglucanase